MESLMKFRNPMYGIYEAVGSFCCNCKFWQGAHLEFVDNISTEMGCIKRAPTIDGFPKMMSTNFCGDFEQLNVLARERLLKLEDGILVNEVSYDCKN